MFTNSLVSNTTRFLYDPISTACSRTNDLELVTRNIPNLKIIEYLYTSNMAKKTYDRIPNNYTKYIQLYMVLIKIQNQIKNPSLLLLIKMIQEALTGAINSYALYGEKILLSIDKYNLEKKVEDILSNKNVKFVNMSNTSGQMKIVKTIKLAAVFSYYINIYGMPPYGVGFDPVKINYLVDILRSRGINPYK